MRIVREDLAWAAGLFEGEGCFTGQQVGRYFYPRAILCSTDYDIVDRFDSVVGIGKFQQRPSRGPNKQKQLEWRVTSFEGFQAVVAMLWPWLGPRRRARAREVLMTYHEARL